MEKEVKKVDPVEKLKIEIYETIQQMNSLKKDENVSKYIKLIDRYNSLVDYMDAFTSDNEFKKINQFNADNDSSYYRNRKIG